ncbi:hypothetical protein B0A48_00120 [Cryoendolithus antarcticus]|uniref:Uncharacterized protein n=1 Tax=Cryoendolithus antarcticus TaxID=1507870 RepID=A0A1V8TTT4_9PEZI|nr:hypothetical protein B0A48_00120 [Cryoendolithus antarcticus]
MAPSPRIHSVSSAVSKKYSVDAMKKIDEQLGGQLPPATIMQGMLLYEAYREGHCQKLFDNVFVRLANSEVRQQKDVLHMKHVLEACATRHSDEATASQAGIKKLMKGLKSKAHKAVVENDGNLVGDFKEACISVMKLLAEEARGTEEQIALTAMLNACHIGEVDKQLNDRLKSAENLIGELQHQIDDLASQRSAPPLQAPKTSQTLPVQTENGEKLELMIPKGQGFVSANQKRLSSMKVATMGNEETVHTPEPVMWIEIPPPSPSSDAKSAGLSKVNGTSKPMSSTHEGGWTDINNANDFSISHAIRDNAGLKSENSNTTERIETSLAPVKGRSNRTLVQHGSKAVAGEQQQSASATPTATGATPAAGSWGTPAPDLTKPLPPPPAATRAGAAKVTLQTPRSSIANPLEIDDDAAKAPARPKRAPASTSSRSLEASPTLTVPAATFKVSSRAAKSIASKAAPASPVTPPSLSSNTSNHSASSASMSGKVNAPSSSFSPGDAWDSSGSAVAPHAKGKHITATATAGAPSATPLSSSWLDSEPDWAQSKAKTTVTVSSEYKPFRGTGGLTGRVPASALAQIDAASGPGNKPSSPPRVMSLAEAGIAPNGDKKRVVQPFSMISGPTSKPSISFQQSTVVLPRSSAGSAAGPEPGPCMRTSESVEGNSGRADRVSMKGSAVTIKSTPAVDIADQKMPTGAQQTTNATLAPAFAVSASTTNGSLQPGLTDVTNRTWLDPATSAYTTSSSSSPLFKATAPEPAQNTPSTPPRTATTGGLSARAPAFSPQGAQRSSSRHSSQLPAKMLGVMDAASREKFMARLEQTMRG